jgi:predicted unusual protein kinase regulating ubiquinone biosynthesis (AarF/ABC1/UbiB family)
MPPLPPETVDGVVALTNQAGETCIAPDYAFVHADELEGFTAAYGSRRRKTISARIFGPEIHLHRESRTYGASMTLTSLATKSPVTLGRLAPYVIDYLRSRPDLLPEFDRWVDPAEHAVSAAMAFTEVQDLLAAELERPLDAAFQTIDAVPIRMGPLSQIHLAATTASLPVAIKARRPDAEHIVANELSFLLRALDDLTVRAGQGKSVNQELKDGLRRWLADEIDGPGEHDKLVRLRRRNVGEPGSFIPRALPDLCGAHVLVFEFPSGVPLAQVWDQFAPDEFDSNEVARKLVRSVLHQVFIGDLFIASLDARNILVLADGRISFLDFSHIARPDPIIGRKQFQYAAAIRTADVDRVLAGIHELADFPTRGVGEGFDADFRRLVRQWERDYRAEPRGNRLAEHLLTTAQLARRHSLTVDQSVLDTACILWRADRAAKSIAPYISLDTVAPDFFASDWLSGLLRSVRDERMPGLGFDIVDLCTDSPGNLVRILSDLADRRFVLPVQSIESDVNRVAAATRARLLAVTGLLIAVSVIGGALKITSIASVFAWAAVVGVSIALLVVFGILWKRLG